MLLGLWLVRLTTGDVLIQFNPDLFVRKPFFWVLLLATLGGVSSFLLLIPNGISAFGNSFD